MLCTIYDLWIDQLKRGEKFILDAPLSIRDKLYYLMMLRETKDLDIPNEYMKDRLFTITLSNIIEGY